MDVVALQRAREREEFAAGPLPPEETGLHGLLGNVAGFLRQPASFTRVYFRHLAFASKVIFTVLLAACTLAVLLGMLFVATHWKTVGHKPAVIAGILGTAVLGTVAVFLVSYNSECMLRGHCKYAATLMMVTVVALIVASVAAPRQLKELVCRAGV